MLMTESTMTTMDRTSRSAKVRIPIIRRSTEDPRDSNPHDLRKRPKAPSIAREKEEKDSRARVSQ
jgi:hypothetical protein